MKLEHHRYVVFLVVLYLYVDYFISIASTSPLPSDSISTPLSSQTTPSSLIPRRLDITLPEGSLLAYDCEAEGIKYLDIDLTSSRGCADPKTDYKAPVQEMVQVLQTERNLKVEAQLCQVNIGVTIVKCGFDSINYGVETFSGKEYMPPDMCGKFLTQSRAFYDGIEVRSKKHFSKFNIFLKNYFFFKDCC